MQLVLGGDAMRKSGMMLRTALITFTLAMSSALVWASITGSVSGIVTDPSDALVVGATVTATNTQTGVKTVIHTDGKGFYNFPNLPVGTYDIQVSQKGFKQYQQTGIVVDANAAIKVDVNLELGEITQEVS